MFYKKLTLITVLLASANADKLRGATSVDKENAIEAELECIRDCPEDKSPVCGNNGFTYTNGCVAKCQGVDKQTPGDCHLNHVQHMPDDGDFEVANSSDYDRARKLSFMYELDDGSDELEDELPYLQFSNISTLGLEYGFFEQDKLSDEDGLPKNWLEGNKTRPSHRNLALDWVATVKKLWSVAKEAYSLLSKKESFDVADALRKMEANLIEDMKLLEDEKTLARTQALADTYLRIQERPKETGNIETFLSNSEYIIATLERKILPLNGARKLEGERALRLAPALTMIAPMTISVQRYVGYSDTYTDISVLSRTERMLKHLLGYDSCIALLDNRVINWEYQLINVVELPTNPPQKGVLMRYLMDKECSYHSCSTYPHEPGTWFEPCSGRICGPSYNCYDCVLNAWKDATNSNKVYKAVRASFRELVGIKPRICRATMTGAKIDSCSWNDVFNSHTRKNWCEGGTFINRFELQPMWKWRGSDSPRMTPAECCHIQNKHSYAKCRFQEVGFYKSHFADRGLWCPSGSVLRAIDQDGGSWSAPNSDSINYPIVGRVNCCKPWYSAGYGQCFWSDLSHKDFALGGLDYFYTGQRSYLTNPSKRWCPDGTVLARVNLDSRTGRDWTLFGRHTGQIGWQSAEHVSPIVADALCCSIKPETIGYGSEGGPPPSP